MVSTFYANLSLRKKFAFLIFVSFLLFVSFVIAAALVPAAGNGTWWSVLVAGEVCLSLFALYSLRCPNCGHVVILYGPFSLIKIPWVPKHCQSCGIKLPSRRIRKHWPASLRKYI